MLLACLGSVGSVMLPAEQIEELRRSSIGVEPCHAVWLGHDPHHKNRSK